MSDLPHNTKTKTAVMTGEDDDEPVMMKTTEDQALAAAELLANYDDDDDNENNNNNNQDDDGTCWQSCCPNAHQLPKILCFFGVRCLVILLVMYVPAMFSVIVSSSQPTHSVIIRITTSSSGSSHEVITPIVRGIVRGRQQQDKGQDAVQDQHTSQFRRRRRLLQDDSYDNNVNEDEDNSSKNKQKNKNSTTSDEGTFLLQCMLNPNGQVVSNPDDATGTEYPTVDEISISSSWGTPNDDNGGSILVGDASVWEHFVRTFDVVPNHTVLDNHRGVLFNVETVPEALPEHGSFPRLRQDDIVEQVQKEAGKFYRPNVYPEPPLPHVTLEVLSDMMNGDDSSNSNVVFAGGQGFLAAAMMAFAYHLPLALSPDHLWTVISGGFAHHVDQYSEELRHHFVNFTEGKVGITIREDSMLMSQSPPARWEELIFPKFAQEIGNHMNNNSDLYDIMVTEKFSTSTPTSQAASEITLMAAMKSYFEYTLVTSCGIPRIQLEGTREDWTALRRRAAQLGPFMMTNHTTTTTDAGAGGGAGDKWIRNIVLPILDQFILAYDGSVNYCFWQNMVKFRNTNDYSGAYDFLSGWLPNLFPYLNLGNGVMSANRYLRHWSSSALGDQRGPNPSQIPIQLASAPVTWNYYGKDYPLHFHAGFRGVEQIAEEDGMLRPVLGWYISHDPEV